MAIGTTAAILGATGIGSSLISGIFGSKAAGKAADVQSQAGNQAADELLKAIAAQNPELAKAMEAAISRVNTASEGAATGIEGAGRTAAEGVTAATGKANELLDPYIQAGAGAVGSLRNLADQQFQFNQDDPSYQFRLAEGQKALERGLAARGTLSGGRATKEIMRYGQGAASQEYQAAFERFMAGKNFTAGTLRDLVNVGVGASGRAGENLTSGARYAGDVGVDTAARAGGIRTGAAQYEGDARMGTAGQIAQNTIEGTARAGDLRTSAAAARAGGIVGKANAWTGALGGAANAVGGALSLNELLKNPALKQRRPMPSYAENY